MLLAVLRAMQTCCVAAGFVKYQASQETVCELVYGGMAALVGLLVDDTQPALVRAETAHVLGCVALGDTSPCRLISFTHALDHSTYFYVVRPRRSRSAAAYSRQTFPWTICRSVRTYVRPCVGPSVCPVHCGKTADRIRMPFGTVGRTGPGMRQLAGFEYQFTEGVLLGANLGRTIVTNGDFTAYACYSTATRSSSQIILANLVFCCFCRCKCFSSKYSQKCIFYCLFLHHLGKH